MCRRSAVETEPLAHINRHMGLAGGLARNWAHASHLHAGIAGQPGQGYRPPALAALQAYAPYLPAQGLRGTDAILCHQIPGSGRARRRRLSPCTPPARCLRGSWRRRPRTRSWPPCGRSACTQSVSAMPECCLAWIVYYCSPICLSMSHERLPLWIAFVLHLACPYLLACTLRPASLSH